MYSKSSKFFIILSALVITAVVFFAGCEKKAKNMAMVGDMVITADEFKTEFISRYHSESNAQRQDFKSRVDVLENLIKKKLMLVDAYRKGLDQKEEIVEAGEMARKQVAIQQLLYKKEVLDKIITEKAVKDYYEKQNEEFHTRHIMIKVNRNDSTQMAEAKVRIDSIRQALLNGTPFDTLAMELSEDPNNAKRGGDLGYFTWGHQPDEIMEALYEMKPGQLSEPVLSPYGYHVVELLDRRPVEVQKPFEQVEQSIRENLYNKHISEIKELGDNYVEQMKEDYGLDYYEESLNFVFGKISNPDTPKNVSLFADFTEEEMKMVVAEWSDGQVTVEDLSKIIKPGYTRLFPTAESLKNMVSDIVLPDMFTKRAQESGVYEAPEALQAKKDAMERIMLIEIKKLEVDDKINYDDQTLKAYYEENLSKYMTEPEVTIREIIVSDNNLAEELLAKGKAGENWEQLAKKHNIDPARKKVAGLYGPFSKNRYGRVGREAHKVNEGDFCKRPIRMGRDKYSVFQIIKKSPPQQMPFEECKDKVKRDYQQQVRADLESEWLDRIRSEIEVKIFEDNLRDVMPFEKVNAPE